MADLVSTLIPVYNRAGMGHAAVLLGPDDLIAPIHMHLHRFGPAPYGMTTVQDFHPEGVRAAASWTALAAMAAAKAVRDVRRLVRAR